MSVHDMIIIGSGPAGLSAAIYAQRAQLDAIVIEKGMISGGQVLSTYEVDNYPGLPGISGFELSSKLRGHADQLGARFVDDTVIRAELSGDIKRIVGEEGTYEAKTVIIATGAHHRKLGVEGEERLSGMGVSYCATCDGAFFRGKTVAVVGGGVSVPLGPVRGVKAVSIGAEDLEPVPVLFKGKGGGGRGGRSRPRGVQRGRFPGKSPCRRR